MQYPRIGRILKPNFNETEKLDIVLLKPKKKNDDTRDKNRWTQNLNVSFFSASDWESDLEAATF